LAFLNNGETSEPWWIALQDAGILPMSILWLPRLSVTDDLKAALSTIASPSHDMKAGRGDPSGF
jgi:hypothetical protein